jgi:hypothetical protein
MAFKPGNVAKVTLATATVKGMVDWKMDGVSVDLLDTTAFGDTAKQFLTGLLDYGTVSFNGHYDPADTTGQSVLVSANLNNSKIADCRLYVDAASYWTPNVTADSAAGLLMQSFNIGQSVNGLGTISFSGKCTGAWVLV